MPNSGQRRRASPPILQNAFRPFFLTGAIWAACLVPLWVLAYFGHEPLAGMSMDMTLHAHEMLYGFLAAIICGFSLTAIPNWTGRLPVAGLGLGLLFGLWLAGRIATLVSGHWLAASLDVAFLIVLAGVVFREITVGKNWRNLPVAGLIGLLAVSHILFHLPSLQAHAIRGTLAVAALLIAVIGGRIVPSFTRNWLAAKANPHASSLPAPMGRYDKVAIAILAVGLSGFVLAPHSFFTGLILLIAGLAHAIRLVRWKGVHTFSEALVWSLHAGYAWLAVACGLIGASRLWPTLIPTAAGFHALAAGLIGAMTLAVMTRASLGHSGRARRADLATTLIYALVHLGAIGRVVAAFVQNDPIWLDLGAGLWSAAFALFAIAFAPMLFGRPPKPAP